MVQVAGGWADLGLTVFDLSNPGTPTPLGWFEDGRAHGPVNDISVDGPRIALAQGSDHPVEGWVTLVDISDPAHPGQEATIALTLAATMTLHVPCDIALRDNYAYVADSGYGLRTIDVRDPTAPRQVAGPATPGSPVSVSVTDRHAMVVGKDPSAEIHGGVSVFDRSDPAGASTSSTLALTSADRSTCRR